jgi:hypothetical protein
MVCVGFFPKKTFMLLCRKKHPCLDLFSEIFRMAGRRHTDMCVHHALQSHGVCMRTSIEKAMLVHLRTRHALKKKRRRRRGGQETRLRDESPFACVCHAGAEMPWKLAE